MKEKELIDQLIDLAFAEDIGDGDHTTLSSIPETAMGKSELLIKEPGILGGVEIAKEVLHRFDSTLLVEVFIADGTAVKPGDVVMTIEGKVQSLLQTERLMLNIMQRMSGIATMTHKYVQQIKGTKAKILDTRKTTPGMRMLEKKAVKISKGVEHEKDPGSAFGIDRFSLVHVCRRRQGNVGQEDCDCCSDYQPERNISFHQ